MAKAKHVLPRDADGKLIYAMYGRLSVGFDGKLENIENQFEDMDGLAERIGVAVPAEYRLSDGLSAWKRNVKRAGWKQFLALCEQGLVAGVLIWHVDRLMRLPRDLEELLALAEERQLSLASAHGSRDLQDPDDKFILRIEVAHACRSSDDTSRRSKRKNEGRRKRGQLVGGGPRAFGWPDSTVSPERLESEQEALKTAFANIAAGGRLQAEVDRLNAAELYSYYGKSWSATTLRNTMSRGRYAGRIEHDREFVGVMVDHDPLIDAETFDRVQAVFASRKRGGPISERSLGAGSILCSRCGQAMRGRPRYTANRTIPTYFCYKQGGGCGRMVIDQAPVDALLRELTARVLSTVENAERASAHLVVTSARRKEVEALLVDADAQMVSLAEKLANRQLRFAAWEAHNAILMAQCGEHEAELAAIDAVLGDQPSVERMSRDEILARWDAAFDNDRGVCRDLLSSATEHMVVRILPGERYGRLPAEERVEISPR